MLANLWMLKAPNGMFWYAVDYLRRLGQPMQVIVRPGLLKVAVRELGGHGVQVHAVGFLGFLHHVTRAAARGEMVYTPTPHPVPLLPRQIITFHDAYPFMGRRGGLKLSLLKLGLSTSRCKVAYINRSAALPYLQALGLATSRLLFAPNMPPRVAATSGSSLLKPLVNKSTRVLGAFGTDSAKKRYAELLAALQDERFKGKLQLRLFGEDNHYVASLRAQFPHVEFAVVEPDQQSLTEFIASLDAVISIALDEGFGRPLATAIVAGVPCYLVDSPTFREFFAGLALLDDRIEALLEAALHSSRQHEIKVTDSRSSGFLADEYGQAINYAIGNLTALATRTKI